MWPISTQTRSILRRQRDEARAADPMAHLDSRKKSAPSAARIAELEDRVKELEEALEALCEHSVVRSEAPGSRMKECLHCSREWYRNYDESHDTDCPVKAAKALLTKQPQRP